MNRLIIAALIVAIVGVAAAIVRRRRLVDAPTQRVHQAPVQLDRADFTRPDAPWLIAVFSSSTCHVCGDIIEKARVLESDDVAVEVIDFAERRDLHDRYAISGVPTLIVVGRDGVRRASFLGPVTATDLWAAVADVRDQ